MEKLDSIINEIICNPSALTVEAELLDKYFALLEKYDYITTINIGDDRYIGFWDDFFLEYQLPQNCMHCYYSLTNNEQVIFQKIFLAILNTVPSNVMKVIPLLVKFDLVGRLTRYLLGIHFFDELDNKLFELINCIQSTPSIKPSMSNLDHEYVLFHDYKKAQHLGTISFVKINEFIESMDRGGKLNCSISLLNLLCPVLYKLNKMMFIDLFNNDSDFMHYLTLIYSLDISQQINVALSSNNVLVKFAVIWHINNYANKATKLCLYPNEVMNLAKLIVGFSADSHVWNEFISYVFSKITMTNNLHNLVCAFGYACNELENNVVRSTFDKFPISKYIGSENIIINNATCFVTSITDIKKQNLVYELLCKRWESFVDDYSKNLNDLLLTNLVNVVINGFAKMQPSSKIQDYINEIISIIDSVDNIWFSSIIEQNNFIYKQLSKLFVYCLALKSIDQSVNFSKLCKVVHDIKFLKNESGQEKTTLMIFNEYLFEC